MNFNGIIIGAAVFLSIGICHPLVIRMEYHWGKQSWWIWLVAGLALSAISLLRIPNGKATMPPDAKRWRGKYESAMKDS